MFEYEYKLVQGTKVTCYLLILTCMNVCKLLISRGVLFMHSSIWKENSPRIASWSRCLEGTSAHLSPTSAMAFQSLEWSNPRTP